MTRHAFTKQVELAFALFQETLASGDLVQFRLNGLAQPLHFGPELCAFEIELQAFELVTPARSVPPFDNAVLVALGRATQLTEIDISPATGARVTTHIADQRPAHRRRGDAIVMDVLLRHIGVMPLDAALEAAGFL